MQSVLPVNHFLFTELKNPSDVTGRDFSTEPCKYNMYNLMAMTQISINRLLDVLTGSKNLPALSRPVMVFKRDTKGI